MGKRNTILLLCVLVAALIAGLALRNAKAETSASLYAPLLSKEEQAKYAAQQKRVEALEEWIEKLAIAESGNRADLVILDTNKRYSFSCLQFQERTFEAYSKKYGMTGEIMDCGFQKRLALMMLLDDRTNYWHWLNSSKKIGTPPYLQRNQL